MIGRKARLNEINRDSSDGKVKYVMLVRNFVESDYRPYMITRGVHRG